MAFACFYDDKRKLFCRFDIGSADQCREKAIKLAELLDVSFVPNSIDIVANITSSNVTTVVRDPLHIDCRIKTVVRAQAGRPYVVDPSGSKSIAFVPCGPTRFQAHDEVLVIDGVVVDAELKFKETWDVIEINHV